jgi:hypothetical protein
MHTMHIFILLYMNYSIEEKQKLDSPRLDGAISPLLIPSFLLLENQIFEGTQV